MAKKNPIFSAGFQRLILSYLFIGLALSVIASGNLSAETTILMLGDSLTAGFGVEKHQAFPSLIADHLKKIGYHDIKIINGGFSGSTSASALGRLKWYSRVQLDILMLELGGNDGLRGLDLKVMEANLAAVIKAALGKKILVLLAGMKIPTNYGLEYTQKFEAVFPALAKKFPIHLIPFLLEGIAADVRYNIPDGIHPNAEGHKIVAKTVLKYLIPLLTKSR